MIRLLIADDEDLIRGALAALLDLEDDLEVVAQAATSTDAVRLALEHRPDIAVLDLEMPPADGLHAAKQIREQLETRVVLVTRHARPGVLRRALSAGVSGFVPKTTPAERLAEILRDVAAGRRYVDPDIAASALTEVHLAAGTVRNYLSTAMGKLDVSSRHAAAHRAWEEGWI